MDTIRKLIRAAVLALLCSAATVSAGGDAPDTGPLRKAAARGDAAAATQLAEALMVEAGGRASSEVLALLEQGAAAGLPRAQAILGAVYLFGTGPQADAARAVSLLAPAAAAGDNEARLNLAIAHEQGAGVPVNLERALELLRTAADDGFAPAMFGVGLYHLQGLGVAADPAQAARWFQRGAEAGEPKSAFQLAEMLLEGPVPPRDVTQAVSWLEQASDGGVEAAAVRLALLLLEDEDLPPDPARARALLEKFARTGHAHSAWLLGKLLDEGEHYPEDPAAAVAWWQQAARAGVADAQYHLARAYGSGRGVEPDEVQREHWLRQAAAGNFVARLELSALEGERERRHSLPSDLVEAIRAAAEAGEAGAWFELGMLQHYGQGLARDPEAARASLRRAAEAGVTAAQRKLGELLVADDSEATRRDGAAWLLRAADAGDPDAQFLLGRALQFGRGVRANDAQARRRFEQAALQEHDEAPIALAQALWDGSRRERDTALAWLQWPDGDERIGWLRHHAADYARGEDGKTPADPAFALLLTAIALELGEQDARQKHDEIGQRLDAGQRKRVDTALSRWKALREPPHPQLAYRAALTRARTMRWDDGETASVAADEAASSARRAFGSDSLPMAEVLELQAGLARSRRDVAAARTLYDRALAIRSALQPEHHPDTIANRTSRASLHGLERDWAAEAKAMLALLPLAERRHGAGSVRLQRLHEEIGNALYFADRATEAIPHLRRSLELIERDPANQEPSFRVDALDSLARALDEAGHADEAVALLEEAIELLRNAGPDVGMGLYPPLSRLVLVLWGEGRIEEAVEAQSQVVALLEAEQPDQLDALATERRLLESIRASAFAGRDGAPPDQDSLRAAAESGDAMAQLRLADHLLMGSFGSVDAEAAAHWYRKSAENGEAIAQYNLAILLGEGRGVAEDRVEAVEWLRRSAAQDFAEAQATLGYYLTDGEGDDDDLAEAVRLFERAAAQNSATGKFNLGNHLIDGLGVEKDVERGLALHRDAAANGLPEAIRALALLQITGEHLPRDVESGRKQLLEAARLGDGLAIELACTLASDGAVQWNGFMIEMPRDQALDPDIAQGCTPGN